MSKLTQKLRLIGIHNEWEFAGKGNVFISYTGADTGRAGHSAHYSVVCPGFQTDPNAHFRHNGNKTISLWNKDKDKVLAELKAWAGERCKITEWARTPFGGWMDAGFVKRRMEELSAKLKEIEAESPEELVPVYGGHMFIGRKQYRVVMAGTKQRFLLATGNSSEYVGESHNEDELKAARAKPGALFLFEEGKNKKVFSEVPEAEWHWAWKDHVIKRARSITRAQFLLLCKIIRDKKQPADPAKTQPLLDLALIVKSPLGIFVGTERGKRIVEHATEKPLIDIEAIEEQAERKVERAKRETENAREEQLDEAKEKVVEIARLFFAQKASMDDLERAVMAIERIEQEAN